MSHFAREQMGRFGKAARPLRTAALAVLLGLSTAGGALAQSVTDLRINLILSNQDPIFPVWEQFARDLEEQSEGTLRVQVMPNEALGRAVDVIDSIARGAPILQHSDPSQFSDYVPDFSVFLAPYLFKKPEDIETAWNSPVVAELEETLEDNGLRIVTMGYFGTRQLIASAPVATRADAASLKLRAAPTKMWNEVARVLGGSPTNTAWSEVYTAMSQGVADGAESPLHVLYSSRLHETRSDIYISLTNHLIATNSLVMSQAIYERLPEAAQQALDAVGRAFPPKLAEAVLQVEAEHRGKFEAEGVTFVDADVESFLGAAATVPASFPEWSEGLYERMLAIIE